MRVIRFLATAVLLALSSGGISAAEPKAFAEVLNGWWDEGSDRAQLCQPGRNLHRHVFSEDGRRITWEFERPEKSYNNTEAKSYTYRVLQATSVSLTMSMEGETRKNDKGQLVVWELVVVGNGMFRWRATDWAVGVYNPVFGFRCKL